MSNLITLMNVTLFDGTGADPVENATIVIDEGRIVDVGGGLKPPASVQRTIECGSRYVIPGIVDAHAHIVAVNYSLSHPTGPGGDRLGGLLIARRMEEMLKLGITTVRDAGGADAGLKEAVRRGLIAGPRLLISNKALSQTGGHGDHRPKEPAAGMADTDDPSHVIADGVDEVRRATREQFRLGADQIKVMAGGGALSGDKLMSSQFSVSELTAIVEEANAVEANVMAHALSPRSIDNCVAAGVRTIEHGNFMSADNAADLKANDMYLVPTLMVYENAAARWEELGFTSEIAEKMQLAADAGRDAVQTAQQAGVGIGFGGDLLGKYFTKIGTGLAIQAEVMGAREALVAATRTNAELCGLGSQIGTLEVGKEADLVMLDGDPLVQPSLFRQQANILMVMKGGLVHKDVRDPHAEPSARPVQVQAVPSNG